MRPRQDITDAELAVIQSLWDHGQATIRQLADRLYSDGDSSNFATVQKLLERLEAKGCVRRLRGNTSPQQFAPTVTREQLIGRRLRNLAQKLCGGSLTPLLTHLVNSQTLNETERNQLRALIDQLDRRPPQQSR